MGGPLLSGALTVAPRLVRIDLPHSLQQVFRVRLGNVGRFGPAAAVAIFRTPRCGADRFLRPFRHEARYEPLWKRQARAMPCLPVRGESESVFA